MSLMNSSIRRLAMHPLALAALVGLGGCSDFNGSSQDMAFVPTAEEHATGDDASPDAEEGKFLYSPSTTPMGRGIEAPSWDDRLLDMTPEERSYLVAVNDAYFGLLAYASADEADALAKMGFPMPEDWIEALQLSDARLKELADSGDRKSRYLYADRLISRHEELEAKVSRSQIDPSLTAEIEQVKIEAGVQASSALRFARSPFAAYLKGRADSVVHGTQAPMAAAMALAHDLGDPRAMDAMQRLSQEHPSVNPYLAFHSYQSMRKTARLE